MTPVILRSLAIAIAVAAIVDPSVSLSGRARPRLAIAALGRAPSEQIREQLAEHLRADFDVVRGFDAAAAGTVVIGDRYPDITLPRGVPVSTVTLAPASAPVVRIASVRAPKRVPPQTALHVEVDVDASGASGSSSLLTITSGGVEVGRASHIWRDADERWRAPLDVIPVGEPPFVLRAEVVVESRVSNGTGPSAERRIADVLVARVEGPLRVLVYEPRPSWASTFVRRSLEGDPRFAVSSLSYASRGIAVRAGVPISLGSADDLANVDVIAVGGLDRLTATDVRALERFMHERGGSVALLPDGRVDGGPARDLVPSPLPVEALLDAHAALVTTAPLPRLDASEMLVFRRTPAGAEVLARLSGSNDPVVLVAPDGDGRLLFSGALDAWRSRADGGVEFDRFWRSAFAGLALATPPAVDVDIRPPILSSGDTARVSVRIRGDGSAVSASLDAATPIRLWPDAMPGVFAGSFVAPDGARAHAIEVTVDGRKPTNARSVFMVRDNARPIRPAAPLALLAASHGGINVGSTELPALERHLRRRIAASQVSVLRRPMRSPLWLIPFAACLSAEWWVRRRRGLR
jgi:hypothetical protein